MARELFERRKNEFRDYIIENHQLPKTWEVRFSDGEDMRLWFDKIANSLEFQDFVNEVKITLKSFGFVVLSEEEKQQEFLNYIFKYNQIPLYGESYFSDNDEMHSWYITCRRQDRNFEAVVYNSLSEYQNLDLASIWSFIKQEFISIIKKLKRIPNYGEVIIQDGIDVRAIYDKLESFDPGFTEELLLYLQSLNKKSLSIDERADELLACVANLGYVPFLQESRFSDGTDMFTWYNKYRGILPDLEAKINLISTRETPKRQVNIYLIPNFRNTGGKFYTICTNVGERLDLSNISSYEEVKSLDDTLVKRGGLILKQDEEIGSVSFGKG